MTPIIINQSEGKWVFEDLARILSRSLWVDVGEDAGSFNYILGTDYEIQDIAVDSFIPLKSIAIASDKRAIERKFAAHNVPRPQTFILTSTSEIDALIDRFDRQRWILKYPTGCGGMNHQIIDRSSQIPPHWPQPFLLQEFIESSQPAVYRIYCVGGHLFGFNVRRFSSPEISNPWVSHANGARYHHGETADREAIEVAKSALIATGLFDSFGVVDLVCDRFGKWYALEVGTDGIYNHVDRDIDNDALLDEINERLAVAFWQRVGRPPWGKIWKYRE
jgi:glutathione synthase/RimK-type ligase-like ATP-grasp enzyme